MEIESAEALAGLLDRGDPLRGVCLQGLDLTGRPDLVGALAGRDPTGLVVLGGTMPAQLITVLARGGALILPAVPDVPFDPYRSTLYHPEELYAGLHTDGYRHTPDARCFEWSTGARRHHADIAASAFSGLHDTAITDALDDLLARLGGPVTAVMGGHGVRRDQPEFATAAMLGHALAAGGRIVATGGGPGAMEAANLGAAAYALPQQRVRDAVAELSLSPGFSDVTGWASTALQVREGLGERDQVRSIGIPTWFYGHEPPNVFADAIAKYFSNALREDVLLSRATGGVIVLPGAAGTVQEIFQLAARNFYATADRVVPLVLVGTDYWRQVLPAWDLLQQLASDRPMAQLLRLCDTVTDAVAAVAETTVDPTGR